MKIYKRFKKFNLTRCQVLFYDDRNLTEIHADCPYNEPLNISKLNENFPKIIMIERKVVFIRNFAV